MRSDIRTSNEKDLALIIARLIFLYIRGENTAFCQPDILRLMAYDKLSLKRIGYLAASVMFDSLNEMTVLIPQTVCKDLESNDHNKQSIALSLVAAMGNNELCRAAQNSIVKLLKSPNLKLQKKAAIAAVVSIKSDHDLLETYRPFVQELLNGRSHSTISAGINLALEMIKIQPSLVEPWSQFASPFTKILQNLHETKPSREFDFCNFNNPFLQIKILQILAALHVPSEKLDDLLTSIITGLDYKKNAARSVLLQTVETISSAAKKQSLRGLAIIQIGRLFELKLPIAYYIALSAFSRFINAGIIDRSSSDSQALQRYKSQVVACLDHPDPSIRRRALDVISALINEENVETLVPEILHYLHLVDADFKAEVVPKLFTAIQRFAPNPQWNFDSVLQLLTECDNYISNDIISSFCNLVSHSPMRDEWIQNLANLLYSFSSNQPLIQVASWVNGEFQNDDESIMQTLVDIMDMPQTTIETKCYIITALSKMAIRFNNVQKYGPYLVNLQSSNSLEIQQRSGEMVRLLTKDISSSVLAPVEAEIEENAPKKAAESYTEDLLGLSVEPTPQPPVSSQDTEPDLLHMQQPVVKEPEVSGPPGSVEALRTEDYVVFFEIQKNGNQIAIRSTTLGLGKVELSKFVIQFGVPIGWAIAAKPPSGNVLEPKGGKGIQQIIFLENRGNAPLVMRTQTSYMYRSQPIKDVGQVNPIF